MDITEQDYLKWISNNKSHMVGKTDRVDFDLLYKYGIPDYFAYIYLFNYDFGQAGEELINCYSKKLYGFIFYRKNKWIMEDKIVIAQHLGSKICINSDMQVVKVYYSDLCESFVNSSFEEFIKFLLIIDKVAGKIENPNKIDLPHNAVLEIEERMKEIATTDWENYTFWHFLLRELDVEGEDDF